MPRKLFIAGGLAGPALIMFTATVIGGGCDYLYQIVMGRQLGPDSYSELNALLSVFYIVSVPTQTVGTLMVRYVSKFKAENKEGEIAWLIRRTLIISTGVGLFIAVAIYLTLPHLTAFISLSSTLPVFILMVGTVIVMVSPVGNGPSIGLQRFHYSGLYSVTGPVTKLAFGVLLIFSGWGVAGALGGAITGTFFAMVVALIAVRDYLRRRCEPICAEDGIAIRRYLPAITVAVVAYALLVNVDIFLARQYLSHYDAGLYSVASILAKVIWFLPGAITIVVFPKLSDAHTRKQGTVPLMRKAILWTFGVTGLVTLAYILFPGSILNFLYGNVYADAAPTLTILGIAMTFFGLGGLFMQHGFATEDRGQVAIIAAFAVVQIALIMLFHTSAQVIGLDLLVTSAGIFLVSWVYMEARKSLGTLS